MGYTRDEIIKKCEDALGDISHFYTEPFVNYTGKTRDTKEYYTEVVAEFVCNHLSVFEQIPMIRREKGYRTLSHAYDKVVFSEKSNRWEEILAKKMYLQGEHAEYDFIGKIIDYQTPLNNAQGDNAGKIDLLSVKGENLYLLELKKEDSNETMLRCVLEGYTYLKTVDLKILKSSFSLSGDIKARACPFVFKNGAQYWEMQENRPWLHKLISALGCEVYYINVDNGQYCVSK